ncbi:deoxyribodipyrimidine photolyase [Vairimorpha necatrix]|uniref:Deoxyribodipyrimidine photo-lyase n=1 Tax=Vairimorpha necatrix TaxID=6039 RepID=A0AAX4JE13_9MICR
MKNRLEVLTGSPKKGNVLYISMRDQRLYNNHCIQYGYNLSYHYKSEFFIGIPLKHLKYNEIQYSLILENIEELTSDSKKYNLYFNILENIEEFITTNKIKNIILDYSPLREYTKFYKQITDLSKNNNFFCVLIDSHNVVPCKLLSTYKRTSSSVKIQLYKFFFEYLDEYDNIEIEKTVQDKNFIDDNMKFIVDVWEKLQSHKFNNKKKVEKNMCKLPNYEKSKYYQGGHKAGMKVLEDFFDKKFYMYNKDRNNPDVDGLSNISPYLLLGILSTHKIIKMAYEKFYKKDKGNLEGFIAEIFIWKETSEHVCLHIKDYDNIQGALEWARNSLKDHTKDKREKLYSKKELEEGKTEDSLWNAAQIQLITANKIQRHVRMYWAKQLVKWTKTPEEAIKMAMEFNDKYSVDGNVPYGYLEIMWSICGLMDRGYKDRPITGKIRPMNKIKNKSYEQLWNNEEEREKYLSSMAVKRTSTK